MNHQIYCLSEEDYDKVRTCLGLLPLHEAREKGKANHVENFVDNIKNKLKDAKSL